MNGYLVMLRHSMDVLPIGLFYTMHAAELFAKSVKPMPTAAIHKVLLTDCATPIGVEIVTFKNGKPTSWRLVKLFDD